MKNLFKIIPLLIIFFCLFSCTGSEITPLKTVAEFEREYHTGGRIYSSLASEADEGYISAEMKEAVFPNGLPPCEYSLLMYSSLSKVEELGVFDLANSGEAFELMSVLEERIKLLSSFMEGESFIYEKGGVIAYGFFKDAEEAKKLLKKLL